MFSIRKQLAKLYTSSVIGNISLSGAWVAILASRGYSLTEIGIAETVFHITSLIFELPSGAMADVFGRKKMLMVSCIMAMIGNAVMIFSDNLFMVCLSIAFQALCYNFSSGSGDALAYDSLKSVKMEQDFERYESNQLVIYRLCGGLSTLCAGFALVIGHRLAYGIDIIIGLIQLAVLGTLTEFYGESPESAKTASQKLISCFKESIAFLKREKRAVKLMFCNSFVGAADILLLFFCRQSFPKRGYQAGRWVPLCLLWSLEE